MSTSSFSLPSASGVVSLLNDARDAKQTSGSHYASSMEDVRPEWSERNSSSSSSIQSPPSVGGTGSSSDADKNSLASTLTTFRESSTDGSESGRLGEIKALRRQLQDHSFADIKQRSLKREGGEAGGDGFVSSSETSQSGECGSLPSYKKQRSKEALLSPEIKRENNDGGHQPGQMLGQERLAASPKLMSGSINFTSEEEAKKDVPMNMHKATSMSENDDVNRSTGIENTSQTSTPGGKRRYPCSHPGCDKTFSTSGHAARHNRIHTGSKPYRCTFPGCNASFSRQDNSLQHYRTHVLHPKSRANGANSSFHDSSSSSLDSMQNGIHSPLGGLDPETEATVRMGRKALEEGTAIAVVHEVVDGSGRKGEAVQRMVGQPRGSRRGSTSSNARSINGRREQQRQSRLMQGYHVEDGADDDEDGLSIGTSFSHSNGVQLPPPASMNPPLYGHQYPAAPPPHHQYHPSQYNEQYHVNQFSDHTSGEDPWSQKAMSYPPPPHAYAPSHYPPSSNAYAHSSSAGSASQSHRPYIYGHGSPSWNLSQERRMSASASSDPSRYEEAAGSSSYDNVHPAYGASTNRGPPTAYSSYLPSDQHFQGPVYPSDATLSYDHRRSHSLGVHGRSPMRVSYKGQEVDQGQYSPSLAERSHGSHSVSLSPPGVKSGIHLSRPSDEALSLLPINTTTRAPYSSVNTNGLPLAKKSGIISPINKGMRSRVNTKDMQLPLPPISKLPCSSDRSTNALTPTTPLDDVKLNRGSTDLPLSKLKAAPSDLHLLPPLVDGGGDGGSTRVLPPLRSSPHSL